MKLIFIYFFVFVYSISIFANSERISLKKGVLPAIDLIYQGQQIDSETALRLSINSKDKHFLAKLNPGEDLFWKNKPVEQTDDIKINLNEPVIYQSPIGSYSRLLRINVTQGAGQNFKNYTIYFDKYLHAAFLRKNLLRKIGYIVPKMKYASQLKMTFLNLQQKKNFILNQMNKTEGSPSRWISKKDINDDSILTITLHDIAILSKEAKDFKNISFGPTSESVGRRVIRSLIAPFSLLGLRESVNGLSWGMGQIKNETLVLKHILEHARFKASIDDVIWSLNRIKKLTRKDFEDIVKNSFFPKGVDQLVLEKIISRRNEILKKLKIKSDVILKPNYKISFKEIVKDGNITKLEWKDYASNFAYHKQATPFDEYKYFIYSKLRSSVMENLLSEANKYFKTFNISDKQLQFHQNQFKDGLTHFIKTGELKSFPVKTWHSPFFNGTYIFNRDIVVGNYMGSDNLVQLADTTGISIDLGVHYGIENIGQDLTGFFQFGTNLYQTFTHLKPVTSLKEAYKMPLSQLFASNNRYRDAFLELSKGAEASDQEKIDTAVKLLKKYLAKGESLIITESVAPRFVLGGSFTYAQLILSPSVGTNFNILKRIQLYRKDENTIQVYSDFGTAWDIYLGVKASVAIPGVIPIINFKAKRSAGKYKIQMYTIDLTPDLKENPNLRRNAFAIFSLLKNQTTELLDDIQKPIIISNSFVDKSSKFSFLFFSYRGLKTQGVFDIQLSEGKPMRFLNIANYSQTGVNKELVVRDTVNYYLDKYITKYNVQVSNPRSGNAAYSIGGKSHTISAKLQLKIEDDRSESYPVLALNDKREGWSLKTKDLEKLIVKINKRYKHVLFSPAAVKLMSKLRVYDIGIHQHLYLDGFQRLKRITVEQLKLLKVNYMTHQKCHRIKNVRCEKFDRLQYYVKKCPTKKGLLSKNKCFLNFAQDLFESIAIEDFIRMIGEKNQYMFASINGFQVDSEVLNDTIYSDSRGRVGDVFFKGPLDAIMQYKQISSGEFYGWWLREKN